MLMTNNARLCPQHREKTVATGCSTEPQCSCAKTCFDYMSALSIHSIPHCVLVLLKNEPIQCLFIVFHTEVGLLFLLLHMY